MKKEYRFVALSKLEREYHELVLIEEVDIQAWYAITYCSIFGEEILVIVQ